MLIIGGVVASFAVFNTVYPAVERSGQAVVVASDSVNDRIMSQVKIIQVARNGSTVEAWVKNTGSSQIGGIENCDVFFGSNGGVSRVSFGTEGSPLPYWSYYLESGNSHWAKAVTARITIYLASPPAPGVYLLKIVIPNGVFDETSFSIE